MFEAGNNLWERRSKHGRDKIFQDADTLWSDAMEYFKHCDTNPWPEQDWVGKDAIPVTRYKKVPYTWTGLALYLDVDTRTLHSSKDISDDFLHIYSRIENIIYTQKLEGASNGFFNASIIARDLKLAETQDISVTAKGKPDWLTGEVPTVNG